MRHARCAASERRTAGRGSRPAVRVGAKASGRRSRCLRRSQRVQARWRTASATKRVLSPRLDLHSTALRPPPWRRRSSSRRRPGVATFAVADREDDVAGLDAALGRLAVRVDLGDHHAACRPHGAERSGRSRRARPARPVPPACCRRCAAPAGRRPGSVPSVTSMSWLLPSRQKVTLTRLAGRHAGDLAAPVRASP